MKRKPRILIWRSRLLPISETFVLAHVDGLKRYVPRLAGLRSLSQMDLTDRDVLHLDSTTDRRPIGVACFRLVGRGGGLVQRIAAWKPDVIHAHFTTDAVDILPVARRLRVPLVVTMHGMDVTTHDSYILRSGPSGLNYLAKRRALQRHADLFLPVSDFIRERALQSGFPVDRTERHYLGMDLSALPNERRGCEARSGLVFVGRLVEKKRPDLVLEAAAILRRKGLAVPVTIIGDGPMMDTLRSRAAEEGLEVNFLGACTHQQVLARVCNSRVFCMPSTEARDGNNEGLPMTYLEAQSCGTPVAAFNQGPVGEAVVHGLTGLLAPDRNVVALANNIEQLLTDDALWKRLSNAGRSRVENEFNIVQQTARLEERYDELLAKTFV